MTDPSRYIHGSDPSEQARLALLNQLQNARSLRALALRPGDRVLDVGSGLGQLSRAMGRRVRPGGAIVGIERDPAQHARAIAEAERDGEAGLADFRLGSVADPPLAAEEWGSFDVAHGRFVLEHLRDPLAAVRMMVAAVRPGGRVVLEDDDHALLQIAPEEPLVMALWRAYAATYEHLGNDPWVGRRLVSLLATAGAPARRSDHLFFGGCAGQPTFRGLVENFRGVLGGARDLVIETSSYDAAGFDAALAAFDGWAGRPDAALWYSTCWAEGVRPGGGEVTSTGEPGPGAGTSSEIVVEEADDRPALLRFLAESAADLTSTLELDEVLATIAARVELLLDAHLFCIMLWNEERQLLEHTYSLKFGRAVPQEGGFALGQGISGSCAASRCPIRVADVLDDPRYVRFRHAEVEVRSELAVPLVIDDRLVGVLDLESTELDAFTEDHEVTLSALASHMATALENARLFARVRRGEARLRRELAGAREIQRALFPRAIPRLSGYEIGTAFAPARELSGDVYDVLPLGPDRAALVLVDVAGKGAAAALLASVTVGMIRALVLEPHFPPAELLQTLNERLHELAVEHRLVALVVAVLDAGGGTLTWSSAGLPAALVVRRGVPDSVELPAVPLGGLLGARYREHVLRMEPGVVVAFSSDGIEETTAADGRRFGAHGVAEVLARTADRPAQAIAEAILEATDRHGAGRPADDDRTVVVVRAV